MGAPQAWAFRLVKLTTFLLKYYFFGEVLTAYAAQCPLGSLGFFHFTAGTRGNSMMKKTYRPPAQSQQYSGTNRQRAAGSRIQETVTLNCDLKK
jgi:hypothetical protein